MKPPDLVFKNKQRTVDEAVGVPEVLLQPTEVEINDWEGIFVHCGMKYPMKGLAYPEAIDAINIVKRQILLFTSTSITDLIDKFVRSADYVLYNHLIDVKYLCNAAKGVYGVVYHCTENKSLASILANIIEYDNAYRYRLQDLFSSTNIEDWHRPRKQIKKFMRLYKKRQPEDPKLVKKVNRMIYLFSLALLYPPFNKKFGQAVRYNYDWLVMDEADRYHCSLRTDYEYNR